MATSIVPGLGLMIHWPSSLWSGPTFQQGFRPDSPRTTPPAPNPRICNTTFPVVGYNIYYYAQNARRTGPLAIFALFRVKSENVSTVDNITNNLLRLLHLLQKPENARRTGALNVVGCVVGSIYNLLQTCTLLKSHRPSRMCPSWTVFPVLREKGKDQGMWQLVPVASKYIPVTTRGIFLHFYWSGGYTSADPTSCW